MADRSISVRLSANVSDFTREINRGTQSLDALVKKSGDAGGAATTSLGKLTQSARLQSEQWRTVGTSLLGVGAAITGVGTLAVKEFASFDQAMSGVASTGDDARQSISALREAAITAGADTAFSATEAANALEELARAGVSSKDALAGGLTGSLDLAAAGQLKVADAAGIASTAMTQFKLSGSQVPHIADLLAAGAGKAMGGVDDLGMALKQGGLVASQFGLSIEETVGGLAAFASQGLLGSDAGTSLKAMLIALANPAGKTAKKMDELGISAYDAQGKFIGLEGLAGQLQDRLGGLSDAQRQQALSQIFGNDAIRAASILYDEGAAGIAQWTAAVDDSGYAARTAAELQNNLIGDLEKLGGSWSTLAITMGQSANGPLREATQGLTGLIDGISALPAPVLDAVTALGGIAGVAALGAGGFAMMLPKALESIEAFRALGVALPGAESKIKTLGKAAAGAAVAFLALEVADQVLSSWDSAAKSGEDLARSFDLIAANKTGLDDLFKGVDGKGIAASLFIIRDGIDDVASSVEALKSENAMGQSQLSMLGPIWAIGESLGLVATDADKAREHYKKLGAELANTKADVAAATFAQLSQQLQDRGLTIEQIIALMPEYANKMRDMLKAGGMGDLAGDANVVADMMAGKLPEGMTKTADGAVVLAGSQEAAADSAKSLAEAEKESADAAKDALDAYLAEVDAIKSLNDAQREGANVQMDAERANAKWIEALSGAGEQIKKNGRSLDENTEKGRSNAEYLRTLAEDARTNTDAMLANGASIDAVNGKMEAQRAQFIKTVGQFGVTGQAAEDLANRYGLIPNYVETVIATPGAKLSQQEADDLNAKLQSIPPELRPKIVTIAETQGAEAARRAIEAVQGKTVTITVRTVGVGSVVTAGGYTGYTGRYPGAATGGYVGDLTYSFASGGTPRRRISGDLVRGPGTPTSDSVPAWLSRDEFVHRAAAVDYYGTDLMYAINALAVPRQALVDALGSASFAAGGSPSMYLAAGGMASADFRAVQSSMAGIMPLAELARFTAALTAASRATRAAAAATGGSASAAQGRVKAAEAALKAARATKGKGKKSAVAAAEKRLADAKAAAKASGDRDKKAAEQLKDAQAKEKDAAKDLAEAHKQLASAARSASESLQKTWQSGGDFVDMLASMRDGAKIVGSFAGQVEKLRAAGLSESLVQRIIDQGEGAGADTAADILRRGGSAIRQLNDAAKALKTSTDRLGILSAVGVRQYADGGIESHVAQIAQPGAMRLWAEPETGGEAYIPLAWSKRGRSEAILREVAGRFGLGVQRFADGAVVQRTYPSIQQGATGQASVVAHVDTAAITAAVDAGLQRLSGVQIVMDGRVVDARLQLAGDGVMRGRGW